MSEDEYLPGSGLVGSPLAPQLGTDPKDLAQMKFDMRRLSVLERDDLGLIMYLEIRKKRIPSFQTILDVLLNYGVSVGGRGRRDIIRMEAVSKGGMANVEAEMRLNKPGMIARNTWNREWAKKQREDSEL